MIVDARYRRDYPVGPQGLAVSEALAKRVLSLPMHPYMDDATLDRIATAVKAVVR